MSVVEEINTCYCECHTNPMLYLHMVACCETCERCEAHVINLAQHMEEKHGIPRGTPKRRPPLKEPT